MTLTTKDKVAVLVAILLGVAFGYLSMLAGYGGVLIDGIYGILIVPLVVLYVADQGKILVWQACIIPSALWVVVGNASLGRLGTAEGLTVFYMFWATGTVISSPVPIFIYWKRSRERAGHQVAWLFLGLEFVGLVSSLWHDQFLFFGLSFLSIVVCLVKFAWEWRRAAEPHGPKTATIVACLVFVLTISTAVLIAVSFKQQAFRSAVSHRYFRLARLFVAIGADPNGRDQLGETALVDAAWRGVGDLNAVNALISMGANVNQEQAGVPALLSYSPDDPTIQNILRVLLARGADVNAKDADGKTAEDLAKDNKHERFAEQLRSQRESRN